MELYIDSDREEREVRRGEDELAWEWDDLDYDERAEQFSMGAASRFYGEEFFAEEWCHSCQEIVFLTEAGECSVDSGHEFKFFTESDPREGWL